MKAVAIATIIPTKVVIKISVSFKSKINLKLPLHQTAQEVLVHLGHPVKKAIEL